MKTSSSKTIAIVGATGQQGSAVAHSLLAQGGWKLRALTRDPSSASAQRLVARGFEVAAADMDDPASLRNAFTGAYGVFSVQATDQGLDIEMRRGRAVADAALAAGVEHFVYSSVGGADRRSGVPHFDSKWQVEQHIRAIGLPATVVRPAFFMDNFNKPALRLVLLALMRSYVPAGKTLQMIAVDDIGRWVAQAFAAPGEHIGRGVEIAGDELTRSQIVAGLRARGWWAGLPFPIPRLALRPLPYDVRRMFEWFGTDGYTADIAGLRSQLPGLENFGAWLAKRGASKSINENV